MRLQIYVDPQFGSERYIDLEPEWVTEAQDRVSREFPFRKYPVTDIQLRDGRRYTVAGHWAAHIKAAQAGADPRQK